MSDVPTIPSTSAAVMGDGVDDIAFPSGFNERRGPGFFEVSFKDKSDDRFAGPILLSLLALPAIVIAAATGTEIVGVALFAGIIATWVRAATMRYRVTVERNSITSVHSPLGGTCAVTGKDTPIVVRSDPMRVVIVDDKGREHVLAAGITEKQAHVLKARIQRALNPTSSP